MRRLAHELYQGLVLAAKTAVYLFIVAIPVALAMMASQSTAATPSAPVYATENHQLVREAFFLDTLLRGKDPHRDLLLSQCRDRITVQIVGGYHFSPRDTVTFIVYDDGQGHQIRLQSPGLYTYPYTVGQKETHEHLPTHRE